jgi:uncharacterized protein involved in exopolysaccharide biosynthesis
MSLEDRVAALEAQVTELREQVTDTHMLAAHADRDVAEFRQELRAQTRLITALRETQVEHSNDTAELKTDVAVLKVDVADLKVDVAEIKGGIGNIVTMLTELINREQA